MTTDTDTRCLDEDQDHDAVRRVHVRPPGATPVDEPTRAVFPAAMAHDRAGRAKLDAELAPARRRPMERRPLRAVRA